MASSQANGPLLTLNDGSKVPSMAFGTGTAWFKRGGNNEPLDENLVQSVKTALELGFRHLDAAELYGTESEIGVAIQQYTAETGLSRKDLYITSKLLKSLPDVKGAVRASLDRLKIEYLDLYLVHAPFLPAGMDLKRVWADLETLVHQGLVRSIGVSNFRVEDLRELLSFASIRPAVNQIEYHPYLQQPGLTEFATQHNITLASYSPLVPITRRSDGPVDPVVQQLAQKYNVTAGQILLRWNLQKGRLVATTSGNRARLQSYLDVYHGSFQLTPEELMQIDAAGAKLHYRQFWREEHASVDLTAQAPSPQPEAPHL